MCDVRVPIVMGTIFLLTIIVHWWSTISELNRLRKTGFFWQSLCFYGFFVVLGTPLLVAAILRNVDIYNQCIGQVQ